MTARPSPAPAPLRSGGARPTGVFDVFRTPSAIGGPVLRLRDHMGLTADPVYLRVAPDPDCQPLSCFRNVAQKIAREGGRAQFGWAVWIWPRVLIEAEHHAVYVPPEGGVWRDITPARNDQTKRRLFLPDDSVAAADGARRDNVRLALSADPLVGEVLAGAEERHRVWASKASGALAEAADLSRLQAAELLQSHAQLRLAMRYTAPEEPCFCASGRRFRLCHGWSAAAG